MFDYEYLPRAQWSNENTWIVSTLNRLQNEFNLYAVNAHDRNGKTSTTNRTKST